MSITVKKTLKIRNKTTNQFEPLAAIRGRDGADGQQGPQGISGATGPQGPAGEDGHTPTTEEIEEVCADALADITTELEEAKRKIKFLDEMSKGQLYDFEEKTESGTSVTPSGAKYQSLLCVDGKTEQTRLNGYQLLNLDNASALDTRGVTPTIAEDGTLSWKGTANATGYIGLVEPRWAIHLKQGVTYTFSTVGTRAHAIAFTDTSYASVCQITSSNTSNTVTPDADVDIKRIFLIGNASDVFDDSFKVMVEKGSTAHSYEPYVGGIPSPNPSYPQEVKGVEELNVRVGSRNIVKNALMDNKANAFTDVLCVDADLKPNTTYVLSFDDVANHKCYLNENLFKVQSYIVTDGNRYSIVCTTKDTISTESGIQYTANRGWRILKNQEANTVTPNVTNVMIEYGSTAHPYEPFSEETRTIIPPKPLYKVGDYVDRLDVGSGEWVYNVDEMTPSNGTSVAINSSDDEKIALTVTSALPRRVPSGWSAIINYFTNTPSNAPSHCGLLEKNAYPRFAKSMFPTLEACKAWWNANYDKIRIYTYLAEPETSPIADADLEWLKSFDGLATDKVWTITDQDGNDVSYLLKYIVKTSEV